MERVAELTSNTRIQTPCGAVYGVIKIPGEEIRQKIQNVCDTSNTYSLKIAKFTLVQAISHKNLPYIRVNFYCHLLAAPVMYRELARRKNDLGIREVFLISNSSLGIR